MPTELDRYLRKFAKLRVSRNRKRGVAPHKPILLLSVFELIEQGVIAANKIELSPELISSFLKYWGKVGSDCHNPDVALPFFHLRSEGFWHLRANQGFEAVLSSNVKLKTIAALQDAVAHAYLDEELFRFWCDDDARNGLLGVLVSTWFPTRAQQIASLFKIESFQTLLASYKQAGGKTYKADVFEDDGNLLVRDAAFRRTITSIYDNRCAVCEMKAIDHLGRPIVDGAHIKPFSKFYDDRIDNGICLCKNHHWAFDRGWFAIDDNFCLLVSKNLVEEVPGGKPLTKYAGHPILAPENDIYYPRQDAVRWHRENVFTRD